VAVKLYTTWGMGNLTIDSAMSCTYLPCLPKGNCFTATMVHVPPAAPYFTSYLFAYLARVKRALLGRSLSALGSAIFLYLLGCGYPRG